MCCELLNRYRDNYKTQSIVETEVKIVETEVKSIYQTHIYTLLPNFVAWYRHFNKMAV
jgi:hypothetical protein